LAVLLLVWAFGSLLIATPESTPRGQSAVLAASSLGHDLDLKLRTEDGLRNPGGLAGPLWVRRTPAGEVVPLGPSFLLTLLAAPFSLVVSNTAMPWVLRVLEIVFVLTAAWFCGRRLGAHFGTAGPLWVAALLFGSTAWLSVGRGGDLVPFGLALLVGAALLPTQDRGSADVYEGEWDGEQEPLDVRPTGGPQVVGAILLGVALAFLALEDWTAALLLLPVFAMLRKSKSGAPLRTVAAACGVTCLMAMGLWTLLAGAAPWNGSTAWLSEVETVPSIAKGELAIDLESLGRDVDARQAGSADLGTLRHAAFQFLLGGRAGLLVSCFPLLVLLLVASRPRTSQPSLRWPVLSFLICVGLLIAFRTFDLSGGPGGPGNRWLLPFVAFLGVFGASRISVPWAALTLLLGQVVQFPAQTAWLGIKNPIQTSAQSVLPLETTQSFLGAGEGVMLPGGLWVRPWDEGALRLRGNAWNVVSIARAEPLSEVVVELSRGAPGQIEVQGGEVQELMFRPDDSVQLQVLLEPAAARHASWWSPEPVYWYRLSIRPASVGAWGFTVRPGRMR